MITSLNVNKFVGSKKDNLGISWDRKYIDIIIDKIKQDVTTADDCFIIQEFNKASKPVEYFTTQLPKEYTIHYPDKLRNTRTYGCTMAITKKETNWEKLPSISDGSNYLNKTIQLRNTTNNLYVLGVHMPGVNNNPAGRALWDKVTHYQKQKEKFLIVGDFNVNKEGDENYDVFVNLSDNYALDAWLQKGNTHDTPSFIGKTRIDYALTNMNVESITMTNHIIKEDISDHEAVAIEIS